MSARRPRGLRRLVVAALAGPLLGLAPAIGPAEGKELIADLSDHLIAITTGFTGTKVLLFGAVVGKGDVIVVVRGPEEEGVVRRKGRVAGIWVNTSEVRFPRVPAFYHVASSRPIRELLPQHVRLRQGIGVETLQFASPEGSELDPVRYKLFRDALIRLKQLADLYGIGINKVTFLGDQLFRTDLEFPANVPIGRYLVEVFLVRNGQVVSAQTTPLVVSQVGVSADIQQFAQENALIYGIIAVAMACSAGMLGSIVFRRG